MKATHILYLSLIVLAVAGAMTISTGYLTPNLARANSSTVRLNEFLPAPHSVDWNGDGKLSSSDEWIEIFNDGSSVVDLSGWQLDDQAGGHSPYTFPQGTTISPGEYLVTYHSFGLNNSGDEERLLSPDGSVVDSYAYDHSTYDGSFSRTSSGDWVDYYPPSPGRANQPPTPTPTTTPTSTPTPQAWRFWGYAYHGVPGSSTPLPGMQLSLRK
jgi:hypothetical protein